MGVLLLFRRTWVMTSGMEDRLRVVQVSELKQGLETSSVPLLIDVRTPMEFSGGHVPGAVNLAGPGLVEFAESFPKDREVWLICRSGRRSLASGKQLVEMGHHVVNVDGGTQAWRAAGWPVQEKPSLTRLVLPGLACMTLGLAPFRPRPHVVEKLEMLGQFRLWNPIDIFDLVMHGAPWLWLAWTAWKLFRLLTQKRSGST